MKISLSSASVIWPRPGTSNTPAGVTLTLRALRPRCGFLGRPRPRFLADLGRFFGVALRATIRRRRRDAFLVDDTRRDTRRAAFLTDDARRDTRRRDVFLADGERRPVALLPVVALLLAERRPPVCVERLRPWSAAAVKSALVVARRVR